MVFSPSVIYDKNTLMSHYSGDVNVNMFHVFKWLLIDLPFSTEMAFLIITMSFVFEKMITQAYV